MKTGSVQLRLAISALAFVALLAASSCVKRQIIITSRPAGAQVYINGRHVGETPATIDFEFYGVREIVVRKPISPWHDYYYLTKRSEVDIAAPWFEYFPLDFFPDVLLPFTIHDRHRVHFDMEKRAPTPEEREKNMAEILKRADELRKRTQGIMRKEEN